MYVDDVEGEISRLTLENSSLLTLTAPENKPTYRHELAPDRMDPMDSVTPEDIDRAKFQLTRSKPGLDVSDVGDAVMALTAGERDAESQIYALASLTQWPAHAIMKLANDPCRCCGSTVPVMGTLSLTVTKDERKKLERTDAAMPGGHFPIPDAKHLGYAKASFKQGEYAGQDPAEVRAHINKNAARLGLPGLDDHDEDDTKPKRRKAPREPRQRMERSTLKQGRGVPSSGIDGSDSFGNGGAAGGPDGGGGAAMSLPGYSKSFIKLAQGVEDGNESALILARNGFGGDRLAKHFDFDVHEVSRDDTESHTDVDAEVARYLREYCNEKPQSGNHSISPKSAAARNRAEQRESTKPQNPIMR